MPASLDHSIEIVTGKRPARQSRLDGGCIGDVFKVELSDGDVIVAKVSGQGGLLIEGRMLRFLNDHSDLPVPDVLHADDHLLLMTWLPGAGRLTDQGQVEAADRVAALHNITSETFGFDFDTLIGGLHQPNPAYHQWLPFFAEQRLIYMGQQALDAGRLPASLMTRLEAFCERLDNWLLEPDHPSLIHGDMWGGNVIAGERGLTGFIDPAIYFADAEIELAFSTLFGTFSDAFFDRYREHRALKPGFFEERRDIYNLYPLLVHVRLFGGSYVGSVDRTLARFGF